MVCGSIDLIVKMTSWQATGGSGRMFMIVSYPWPVASAHVHLDGRHADVCESTNEQQAWRAEDLVHWTGREWLRFSWYRLRLTVRDANCAPTPR
jgi:hypothetical protein